MCINCEEKGREGWAAPANEFNSINIITESSLSGSHHIFKTPWQGDPRLNLQRDGSKAKPYQVRDVVKALKKLQEEP